MKHVALKQAIRNLKLADKPTKSKLRRARRRFCSPCRIGKKVVLNFGFGVESTAILVRWILEPASRYYMRNKRKVFFDLSDLIVVSAQLGSEMPDTEYYLRRYILPLLNEHGVRWVQIAKSGPTMKRAKSLEDYRRRFTVLSDSTYTEDLFMSGDYNLKHELEAAATVPQAGGGHTCAIKHKGDVIDAWLMCEMRDERFVQCIGYNADETGRAAKDAHYNDEWRKGIYALLEWGWSREQAADYLESVLGEAPPKSACFFCPFQNIKKEPEVLARFRRFPKTGAEALLIEHNSLAFNENQSLFPAKRLLDFLREDMNDEALSGFERLLDESRYAIYHVRRLALPCGEDEKGNPVVSYARSVKIIGDWRTLSRDDARMRLRALSAEHGVDITYEAGVARIYLRRREEGVFPTADELIVAAPNTAQEKTSRANFETLWKEIALGESRPQMELFAEAA